MGNGTNANPDETFMIAAFDFVFKCGKNCFTMRIGPLKLISISRVMSSCFVVNIDLTHDTGVVDQNVELRELFGDIFVESGDRFRIGNVASKGSSECFLVWPQIDFLRPGRTLLAMDVQKGVGDRIDTEETVLPTLFDQCRDAIE